MRLQISQDELRQIQEAQDAIFLGIITARGIVRVIEADRTEVPGHAEWLARQPIEEAERGFSLVVRGGQVSTLFRLSRLNPTTDGGIENRFIAELKSLLPFREDYRTFSE